jgi:two-component system sensor histidine kinase RegB
VRGCLERFQLLRPEAELELELDAATADTVLRSPPGMRHALINLLNNAADASAARGSQRVALRVRHQGGWLELRVSDQGPGFAVGRPGSVLGQSQKQSGLGIGLTLAEATAERLNGELTAVNTSEGAEVSIRLPLSAIAAE